MKILAIHGSPRTLRSTTRQLVSFVLAGAEDAGAETEIIDLADLRVVPCTGCDACAINGVCVNDDDLAGLVARMKEADAIIFGSPVYIDNVSGQMKVFFDRLADAIHYQQLAGKYGCSVATTAESGGDEVVAYENHVLNYLGAVSVGDMSIALGTNPAALADAEPAARALGKKLVAAVRDGFSDPAQEAAIAGNRAYFAAIVQENRDFRPDEYARWEKAGWL
ncbi:flavodoxin family protein [Methanoregula sp. UBA64]|jgi:multimeric flavodoxin WrbA|uniref:flavodoxin family protein n=1 Tax=Methanoregula sp. UBA64 TaxID=1915554 RepID=UPI0025EDDAEF|nr:flavodoxin family protein [Methanoregula sp. UBA64]